MHVVVRLDVVANEIGGLFSQLSFEPILELYLISCIIVGIGDNLDLSGNVDVVVDPRDKADFESWTRKKRLLGSRQCKVYLSSLLNSCVLNTVETGKPR